ncbi:hypothetical protein [Halalkalibacter alkalisediminis]|uniref:Uncharacterized protein n=1 Tax=Halalkalibacter alkalisediminis TaxID=935616 RepID=A0ABV6NMI9_9BACI|nr:hypothetical protein [Halalkalibacter alkalisediminis]
MNNKEQQELLFKQLTHHFLSEQLEQLKGNKEDKNRSFIYLESNTINILLVYLLMQMNTKKTNETASNNNNLIPEEIVEEINSVLHNNKKSFEDIISQLKEKT